MLPFWLTEDDGNYIQISLKIRLQVTLLVQREAQRYDDFYIIYQSVYLLIISRALFLRNHAFFQSLRLWGVFLLLECLFQRYYRHDHQDKNETTSDTNRRYRMLFGQLDQIWGYRFSGLRNNLYYTNRSSLNVLGERFNLHIDIQSV